MEGHHRHPFVSFFNPPNSDVDAPFSHPTARERGRGNQKIERERGEKREEERERE
jgi:hypothetical protein